MMPDLINGSDDGSVLTLYALSSQCSETLSGLPSCNSRAGFLTSKPANSFSIALELGASRNAFHSHN